MGYLAKFFIQFQSTFIFTLQTSFSIFNKISQMFRKLLKTATTKNLCSYRDFCYYWKRFSNYQYIHVTLSLLCDQVLQQMSFFPAKFSEVTTVSWEVLNRRKFVVSKESSKSFFLISQINNIFQQKKEMFRENFQIYFRSIEVVIQRTSDAKIIFPYESNIFMISFRYSPDVF